LIEVDRWFNSRDGDTSLNTKLLLLTNQPKLTLTVTLTLTDIFMLISLKPIKRLFRIDEGNFFTRLLM